MVSLKMSKILFFKDFRKGRSSAISCSIDFSRGKGLRGLPPSLMLHKTASQAMQYEKKIDMKSQDPWIMSQDLLTQPPLCPSAALKLCPI